MRFVPTTTKQIILRIHIRQALFLQRESIPDALLDDIARTLTIENPKYQEALKAGRWTGGLDKFLTDCF